MPTANNKTKRNKNTFSSLDDNDSPANTHGTNEANSSNETASPSDSDILCELAESMRSFWLDFEKYKTDNDARAKTFEDKLDDRSGTKDNPTPRNADDSAQSGVSQDGTSQDFNSTSSAPPNVTPRQPDGSSPQNQGGNFTRKILLLLLLLLQATETQFLNLMQQLSPRIRPNFSRKMTLVKRHNANRCWVRGLKWMPLWLRRNVAKYNALRPNDEPDCVVINADPPLRKATIKSYNPVTKKAIFEFSDSDKTVDIVNFADFDIVDTLYNIYM